MSSTPLPTEADNNSLRRLVEHKLLGRNTNMSGTELSLGQWSHLPGGVFITGYKRKDQPLTSENVWCCMSNGEYDGKQSVYQNAVESIRICRERDSRRTHQLPETYEITVLAPKPWRQVGMNELHCGRHRAISVTVGGRSAVYLPSVWYERPDWSAEEFIASLVEKAGGEEGDVMIYEIDVYAILPEIAWNQGYFPNTTTCIHEGICGHLELKGVRPPSHAGSWYPDDPNVLRADLQNYLQSCSLSPSTTSGRILIVPHAGYNYSGSVLGCGYTNINTNVKRVFLLGPSHFTNLTCCALTTRQKYATPLGDLTVDSNVMEELRVTLAFTSLDFQTEDQEHSLEMQLPFIVSLFGTSITLVPILVGTLSPESEQYYGHLLASYLDNPENLFIISSDFCHWGSQYHYTPKIAEIPIWQTIELLDMHAIEAIIAQNVVQYHEYFTRTSNTICGRFAIGVLLAAMASASTKFQFRLLDYRQSEQVTDLSQSSVSYATIVA